MPDSPSFDDLIRRVRAGDERAAEELVRSYEPEIREAVRRGLRRADLGRILDSMNISQSVLNSFFFRAKAGQYDLKEPKDLVNLLVRMARNKLIDQGRRHREEKARTQQAATESRADDMAGTDTSPSQQVARLEQYQQALRRLSPEERRLVELRNQGRDWKAVAAEMGGTPQGRRKQLDRALHRVGKELGLE